MLMVFEKMICEIPMPRPSNSAIADWAVSRMAASRRRCDRLISSDRTHLLLMTKDILGWVFGPNPFARYVIETRLFILRKAIM